MDKPSKGDAMDEGIPGEVFFVLDEPYLVCGFQTQAENLLFLQGIDANYFQYVLDTNLEKLEQDGSEMHAAVSLRLAFYQGMETFFALVGASIQAPTCVAAWMQKYKTIELRQLVESVSRGRPTGSAILNLKDFTWAGFAKLVMANSHTDIDRLNNSAMQFSNAWGRLASEFLSEENQNERNSLQHGFRVRPGGGFISAGIEPAPGVAAPPEAMKLIGGSKYGSSTRVLLPVHPKNKESRCFYLKAKTLNWSLERTILALQLIRMSIQNVVSFLCILNGKAGNEVQFLHPAMDEDLTEAWKYSVGVTSMSFGEFMDADSIPIVTRSRLISLIEKQTSTEESSGEEKEA